MNGRGGYESPYYNAGAGGGGGGGGFVSGGGNMSQGSQGSPGGGKGKVSSIRPVTLKQLESVSQPHPDADFSLNGVDIALVSVVAVARNVSRTPTQEVYMIEDGTGGYEARRWFSKDESGESMEEAIEQDTYVFIVGEVKEFGGKRHLSIKNIRKVTDFNEVSYHLLESLSVSLQASHGGMGGARKAQNGMGYDSNMGDYNMAQNGLLSADHQGGGGAGGGAQDQWAHYPPIYRRILEYTQEEGSKTAEGVNVVSIARHVGGDDPTAIIEAIENLVSDGALYSTIDDEHVKVI